MSYLRRTIRESTRFKGLGLHTGSPVTMAVHPARDGIHFRYGSDRFQASPENVTDTTRSTKLGSIGTVEHIMSALAGLQITDAEIEVDAPEIPGMDGSSLLFVQSLTETGFQELGRQEQVELYRRVFLQDDLIKVAVAKGTGHWRYDYDLGSRWPGHQSFESASVVDDYATQIAGARTFALAEELPLIEKMGLGRGLDESSALIVGDHHYQNQARFADEPARHKLLDLIGDLYLAGLPIAMLSVVAERSGHAANVKTALMLKKATHP